MIFILTYATFLILLTNIAIGQSGASLKEFEGKLSGYYDSELIADVINAIGTGEQPKVWSWDIGDFSMDEHNDLACVVRYSKEKSKKCSIFFFTDINGTLTLVGNVQKPFVDSPLEVGVAIKNSTCYLTSKKEQFNWDIIGYRYRHGYFFESDSFSTLREGNQTIEISQDYVTSRNTAHAFATRNEETSYYHHFHEIAVFKDKAILPSCYSRPLSVDMPDDVLKGAFFWKGGEDASFNIIRSTYTQNEWKFSLLIKDDVLIESDCDSCLRDKVIIHLSIEKPDIDDISKIRAGTDKKKSANMTIELIPSFESPFESFAKIVDSVSKQFYSLPVYLKQVDGGYIMDVSIPFKNMSLIDFTEIGNRTLSIGCTFVLNDTDNPFRSEETTQLFTSDFEQGNPRSYGLLTFHHDSGFMPKAIPFFAVQFVQSLKQLGF